MDARRWATAVVVTLASVIAIVALWPASDPQELESTAAIQETVPARNDTTTRGLAGTAAPRINAAAAAPEPDDRFVHRADRVSQAIALMRFPASSQPLRMDMRDVIYPNRRHETPLPLAIATGASKDQDRNGDLSFLFTGDVFTVLGDGALDATLEVYREHGGQRERIAIDVVGAQITLVEAAGARPIPTGVVPNDEGRDGDTAGGDKVYGVAIVPAAIASLAAYRGLARLDVDFVASEGDHKRAHASLDFRVANVTPATFSGVASERVTPDGLEIAVGLKVDEPGQYVVEGLLFDARDEPIGFAVAHPTLAAGAATVPLLYWGLLFHDANAAGPYTFRTVTGYRLPGGNEPDRADMASWPGPYKTRPYAVSDFSDKEYESAAKEAKIKALSDLAARGVTKGAPPASP